MLEGRLEGRFPYMVLVGFVGAFCLLPLAYVAAPGVLNGSGEPTGRYILEVLTEKRTRDVLAFTMLQAAVSTVAVIALALPGAWVLSRRSFPGRSLFLALTTVPFVLPPLVMGIGFIALFGANGYMNDLLASLGTDLRLDLMYTPTIIILAHIFLDFPVALRVLYSRMGSLDGDLEKASMSMGANALTTFSKVTLPQMRYSLLGASSLVFTYCFLTFGVIMVIGGLTNSTIEVEIWKQFNGGFDRHSTGALLIVETAIMFAVTMMYVRSMSADGREGSISRGERFVPAIGSGRWTAWSWRLYTAIVLVIVIGPMVALVLTSFNIDPDGGAFTLQNIGTVLSGHEDASIGTTPLGAVANSIAFGILATLVTVPLSVVAAYALDSGPFRGKTVLDALVLFPIGASSIALGYGLARGAFGGSLSGTWMIVVIVHVLLAYPFCTRAVLSSKREMDEDLVRAAVSMGANRWRRFIDVHLPVLARGIMVSAVFAFAISLGEFGATLMVYSPEFSTMPVALFRFLSDGRDIGAVAAYGALIVLITATSVFGLEMIGKGVRRWY